MPSSYPAGFDSLAKPTSTTQENDAGFEHDVVHTAAAEAIEAVQAELGLDPAGAAATVAARLDALDTTVAGKEASGTAAAAVSAHEADTTSVHGIADTSLLETTSGATAKVAAHTAATDPHGDRAYTDSAVSGLATDSAVVHLTGAETVAGVKTFSSSPVVPTPSAATDAANKDYVDGAAALSSQSEGTAFGRAFGAGSGTPGSLTARQIASIVQSADSIFNVCDARYGAVGDGSTDDTAAINLAIADLNASTYGGVLYFPPKKFKVTAALTAITKPARVLGGAGGATRYLLTQYGATILQTSKTDHTLTLSGPGGHVEGLLVWNSTYGDGVNITGSWPHTLKTTALPTAGSGIRVYSASLTEGVPKVTIRDCHVYGFYRNIDVAGGIEVRVEDSTLCAPVKHNLRLANPGFYDGGHFTVTGCEFMQFENYGGSTVDAHIRWESGGGVGIFHNRFVSGLVTTTGDGLSGDVQYAIDLSVATANSTSGNGATGDLHVSNNHIESHGRSGGAAVRLVIANDTTAQFNNVVIADNYINTFQSSTSASYNGIELTGNATYNVKNVAVTGNTFKGGAGGGSSTGYAVKLTQVTNYRVSNVYEAGTFAGATSFTSCTNDQGTVATTYQGAFAYRSTNQSISSATDQPIAWTVERHDTNSYHDTATNNERFTADVDGYYRLSGQVNINASGTVEVYTYPSGTGTGGVGQMSNWKVTTTGRTATQVDSGDVYLTAGKYLTANVYVTSGTSVTVDATGSFMTFRRVGS